MKYNVIIVLDESRNRSYYYSYVEKDGNIECEELPPYQDILKARSCYWDAENMSWIFDNDKYTELIEEQLVEKESAEQAKKEAASIPTNAELMYAILDIASKLDSTAQSVSDLKTKVESIQKEES